MEKFRITDIGILEIRMFKDRVQFSTTPDYQETIAELSKENAVEIANKIIAWANSDTSENSLHKHIVSESDLYFCDAIQNTCIDNDDCENCLHHSR